MPATVPNVHRSCAIPWEFVLLAPAKTVPPPAVTRKVYDLTAHGVAVGVHDLHNEGLRQLLSNFARLRITGNLRTTAGGPALTGPVPESLQANARPVRMDSVASGRSLCGDCNICFQAAWGGLPAAISAGGEV